MAAEKATPAAFRGIAYSKTQYVKREMKWEAWDVEMEEKRNEKINRRMKESEKGRRRGKDAKENSKRITANGISVWLKFETSKCKVSCCLTS